MSNDNNNNKNPLDAASTTASELNEMNTMADSRASIPDDGGECIPTDIGYPTNFKQVGKGKAENGNLVFTYTWESSTGKMCHLRDTKVGERVTYPTNNPVPGYPNTYMLPQPPFVERYDNPTIKNVDGAIGVLLDTHLLPRGFTQQLDKGEAIGTQEYRYLSRGKKETEYVTLMKDIKIKREVTHVSGDMWRYTCTKLGSSATYDLQNIPESKPSRSSMMQELPLDKILKTIHDFLLDATKKDVLSVFCRAEGLSTPSEGTFRYLDCRDICVDITFECTKDEWGRSVESLDDHVVSFSSPYLQQDTIY